MVEEVNSNGIENLSSTVKSPDDASELISKIECVLENKKQYFSIVSSPKYKHVHKCSCESEIK